MREKGRRDRIKGKEPRVLYPGKTKDAVFLLLAISCLFPSVWHN